MADARVERLAEVLVGYSASVQPGELVTVEGTVAAMPLIVEVYRQVLAAGGHPLPKVKLPRETEILYATASDEQLDWVDPAFLAINEQADVRIIIDAESNTKALSNVAPARQSRRSRAREASRNRYLERAAAGELKWVLTAFPTEAAAQDAEMSLAEYFTRTKIPAISGVDTRALTRKIRTPHEIPERREPMNSGPGGGRGR